MSASNKAWLIIDGYSLLHRDPQLKALAGSKLELARDLLVRTVEQLANQLAQRTTIVFDGRGGGISRAISTTSLEILFTPTRYTADTVIERLVSSHKTPAEILVVTSDRAERDTVSAAGADSLSSGDFLSLCRTRQAAISQRSRARKARNPTIGEFFPPQ